MRHHAIVIIYCHLLPKIKERLEQNWVRFVKANSDRISFDIMAGSTPPSIFVGNYGYPKVRIGPMISSHHGDTTILGRTELWAGKKLEEIASATDCHLCSALGILM